MAQDSQGEHDRDPLQDRELFAGGVFAAANHVASFCKQVDIITCLGDVDSHEDLIRQSLQPNVRLRVVHSAPARRRRSSGASSTPPTCASCSKSIS